MKKNFAAINYISCLPEFEATLEDLFATRKGAIDKEQGFIEMEVLKPLKAGDPYLILSHWESKEAFENWTKSEAFLEGHKRGFAILEQAKKEGKPAPMKSDFKVYKIIAE